MSYLYFTWVNSFLTVTKPKKEKGCKKRWFSAPPASSPAVPLAPPDATMHSTYRVEPLPPSSCQRRAASTRRHYVTSMATVLSAILLSAGLSSSWLSLREKNRDVTPWSGLGWAVAQGDKFLGMPKDFGFLCNKCEFYKHFTL